MSYIHNLAVKLKTAMPSILTATTKQKNDMLLNIADALIVEMEDIIKANEQDVLRATQNGVSPVMLDRLILNGERINAIANAVRHVAELTDPIGQVLSGNTMPSGLEIRKERVPLGCIGIIYESRPNVTVDAAVLCLKAGNAVLLRGGKEAINTNIALVKAMHGAIEKSDLPADILLLVEELSRETAIEMMKLNGYLDVLIPRGGAGLIQSVISNSTLPVIETGIGNCHIYVDKCADINMAASILYNAKTSRPSVCNACESLLVHSEVAKAFLPLAREMLSPKNVIILGCEKTKDILDGGVTLATEDDYKTEFLDFVLSVKVVDSLDEAIEHINKYSTGHSETIVTKSLESAQRFTHMVDSAAVYVNASTRFTDGNEFGLGAEIGISTQKLHARGPMGLDALTSSKFIVIGEGQIRE